MAIATAALEGFKNEAKKMVVALVDMERAFVPPQHFIRLVQRRYALLRDDLYLYKLIESKKSIKLYFIRKYL